MIYGINEYKKILRDKNLLVRDCPTENILVKGLTYDNRSAGEGTLFVCKGAHFKTEYLIDAVKRGAIAYVSETEYGTQAPCLLVSDVRKAMVYLAELFYGNAPSKLVTVGLTGTKGKSTTAYYIKSVLDIFCGRECAILSSIDNYDGIEREESHLTTPEAMELHRHCANALKSGISHLIMEVSSQALKYDRVLDMNFDVAAFLNIGLDHISGIEHSDFEDYFSSKLKIFLSCKNAVVNRSCDYADRILSTAVGSGTNVVTFGRTPDCDYYPENIVSSPNGIKFEVVCGEGRFPLSICMTGLFNVDNALCATAVCRLLGVPFDTIGKGLKNATTPGRMEVFSSNDGNKIVNVDYAHNKMSFDALYSSTAEEYPGHKIVGIFGCPGGKAFGRRRDLPLSAAAYSSKIIITEEDSGEEPFSSIAADLEKNLKETSCPYEIIEDREEAIRQAILFSGEKVVVLLTGKGRETRMKRGTLYVDTPSDVDFTLKYLDLYNGEKS